MDLIASAKAVQNGRACHADIDLLVKVLGEIGDTPCVVMLGAGEVFTITVFGAKPNALLYTVDIDEEAFNWENVAKANCGVKTANHVQVLGNSPEVAKTYRGPKIDLLIVDADHSAEGVWDDLKAWGKHLSISHYMFFHDYEAKDAPYYYPGVKKACDKFFGDIKPVYREGWSAVWEIKIPKKADKKGTKKTTRKDKK